MTCLAIALWLVGAFLPALYIVYGLGCADQHTECTLQETALITGLKNSVDDANAANERLKAKKYELETEILRLNSALSQACEAGELEWARAEEAVRWRKAAEAAASQADGRAEQAMTERL
eukprot:scaffold13341_cov18-Prasinocladus_malaysianus.AAC.1